MNKGLLKLSALSLSLFFTPLFAQDNDDSAQKFQLKNLPSNFKLSYERADFKNDGDTDLLGVNYLFQPLPWIYTGVGGYAATYGDLGGLFILGVDAGVEHSLYKDLWFSAGYFAGGGGANHTNSDENSGFMGRPHAGLSYHFGSMALGFEFSRIHFPDYDTDSNQVAFTLSTSSNFLYGDPSYAGQSTTSLADILSPNYLGFYNTYIGFTPQTYFLNDDGVGNMQLAGIEAGVYYSQTDYASLSMSGAYDSSNDGYMDMFIGWGHIFPLATNLNGFIQGDIGAGGGGDAQTGGGFMFKPMLGVNYAVTQNFSLKVAGGYVRATGSDSDFDGAVANVGVMYNFLNAATGDLVPADTGNDVYQFDGWRFTVGNENYISPQREDGKKVENISLITVSIDRDINKYFFVTGQAASAYRGNAGSYASGLLGLGVQTPARLRTHFIADIMAGAAGGASMAVDRGAIYQPEAGLMFDATKNLSLTAKGGKVKAFDGDLDSTTWNVGITYRFSTLQENK